MGSPAFQIPPGFTEAPDQSTGPTPGQTQTISTGPPSIPAGSPIFEPSSEFGPPPGFLEEKKPPKQEEGYFKQVKDRISGMAAEMYDAWEKGDFPRMTGIPGLIGGLNKQYYDTLWRSQSPSEFLTNLVPIFGPIMNNAIKESAQGRPRTSSAMLTTDVLLPLLAEKLPSAALSALPKSLTENVPTRMMTSALKPTISKFEKVARASEEAVQTALDFPTQPGKAGGVPVSEGGFRNLTDYLRRANSERREIFRNAPEPEIVLTPKSRQIAQGGAPDFELGPITPPPGTQQTVLSHGRMRLSEFPQKPGKPVQVKFGAAEEVPALETRLGEPATREPGLRPTFTAEPAKPAEVAARLEHARNQQMIAEINRAAQESGLLDAVQEAARKAGQPVPYDITEAFNVSFKNVIDPQKYRARIEQLKKRYGSVAPQADLDAIESTFQEFLDAYPHPLSYRQAQAVRLATSRKLGNKAYLAERGTAKVSTEMELERAIMEDLKEALPELKTLNPQESKALGLLPELRRALGRRKNWEMGTGIQAGAGAVVGGAIGSLFGMGQESAGAAAIIAAALRDPMVKSKLAIALNRVQKSFPNKFGPASVKGAEAKINAYLSSLDDVLARAGAGALGAPGVRTPGINEPQEETQ